MWLKVCGIQTEKNGIFLAGRNVDAIGLNRYPKSSRYVDDEKARAISLEVHHKNPSVSRVGIYVNEKIDIIRSEIRDLNLDIVQLHGDEPPESVDTLSTDADVIKAFSVGPDFDENRLDPYDPWAFLLDGHVPGQYGGTGETAPWQKIRTLTNQYRIILAGGLTPENIQVAAHTAKPWGLDVNSGVESSDGTKDLQKLKELIKQVNNLEKISPD